MITLDRGVVERLVRDALTRKLTTDRVVARAGASSVWV